MIDREIKVGDKVRCIPGFVNLHQYGLNYAGAGYVEGKTFKVSNIEDAGPSRRGHKVIWGSHNEFGIYDFALRHVDPIEEIIEKIKGEVFGK